MRATPEEMAVIEAVRKWRKHMRSIPYLNEWERPVLDAIDALDASTKRAEAERRAHEVVAQIQVRGHTDVTAPAGVLVGGEAFYLQSHVHAAIVKLLMEREP